MAQFRWSCASFGKLREVTPQSDSLNLKLIVLDVGISRKTRDGKTFQKCKVADGTGCIELNVWDELADCLDESDMCELINGFASVRQNSLQLNCGRRSTLRRVGKFCMLFSEIPDFSIPNADFATYSDIKGVRKPADYGSTTDSHGSVDIDERRPGSALSNRSIPAKSQREVVAETQHSKEVHSFVATASSSSTAITNSQVVSQTGPMIVHLQSGPEASPAVGSSFPVAVQRNKRPLLPTPRLSSPKPLLSTEKSETGEISGPSVPGPDPISHPYRRVSGPGPVNNQYGPPKQIANRGGAKFEQRRPVFRDRAGPYHRYHHHGKRGRPYHQVPTRPVVDSLSNHVSELIHKVYDAKLSQGPVGDGTVAPRSNSPHGDVDDRIGRGWMPPQQQRI